MAFTILYLLWRYNDIIDGLTDFGGGEAWDFLPVCRMHAHRRSFSSFYLIFHNV